MNGFMLHRRRRSHNLRNALIAIIVLILVITVVVVAYQIGPSSGPPTYSDAAIVGLPNVNSLCIFSVRWNSAVNVSGFIFGSNNTGTFVNDTWRAFTLNDFVNETSAYSTVQKTLNGPFNSTLSWRFWCNDTKNRWTGLPLESFLVVSRVLLVTNMGNIEIQPYADMPITAGNFLNLVNAGVYDNTNFSRIAYDPSTGNPFVIQGGDATPKNITVPTIQDELPTKHSNVRGSLAMAKLSDPSGVIPNSASDQFFINLADNSGTLDTNFSVFGTVVSGMGVVDAISGLIPFGANATSYDGPPRTTVTIITAQLVS